MRSLPSFSKAVAAFTLKCVMRGSVPDFSAALSASKISSRSFASPTSAAESFVSFQGCGVSARNLHQASSSTDPSTARFPGTLMAPRLFPVRLPFAQILLPAPLLPPVNLLHPLDRVGLFRRLVGTQPDNPRKTQGVAALVPLRPHDVVERHLQHDPRLYLPPETLLGH